MPITLSALYRYPIKSTHGSLLAQSSVSPLGLPDDRAWMIADEAGRFLSGRELPQLVTIHATPDPTGLQLTATGAASIRIARSDFDQALPVQVWGDRFIGWQGAVLADAWFSKLLGRKVQLIYIGETQRRMRHQPDVPLSFVDGYPLLLIGEDSRRQLSSWVGRDMAMMRFRPNLVIDGVPAFAEDGWQRIRIGDVTLRIVEPCTRCVFTTVDPDSGEKSRDQEPIRTLAKYRKREKGVLFGQNVVVENTGELAVGMRVEILA